MDEQDGGQAFPRPGGGLPGMSLRDWFAGMAMQGKLANGMYAGHDEQGSLAKSSYRAADAMLAARGGGS